MIFPTIFAPKGNCGLWDELREQAELELNRLRKLANVNSGLLAKAKADPSETAYAMAIGGLAHPFYNGVENLFRRIALEMGGSLPEGSNWHKELLEAMSRPTPSRPAVISNDLKELLSKYLSFRHLFRNIYLYDLDWEQLEPLSENLEKTRERLEAEISVFFENAVKWLKEPIIRNNF
jgi:hypothetical protein